MNAVKGFAADPEDLTTDREPTAAERRRCRSHLTTELDQVDPAVVVTTGRHVTASVLSLGGHSINRFLDLGSEPRPVPGREATLLPLLHPSNRNDWRSRLGYADRDKYVTAIGVTLDQLP